MRSRSIIGLILFVALTGFYLRISLMGETKEAHAVAVQQDAIRNARRLLRENYYDENYFKDINPQKEKELLYGVLRGMTGALDRHTNFLDPGEYKELSADTRGHFYGLGVMITLVPEKGIRIESVFPDYPAFKSGIKEGDVIVKIDGVDVGGLTMSEARRRLIGEENTKVNLTVLRGEKEESHEIEVIREKIELPSVRIAEVIEPRKAGEVPLGYIDLEKFQSGSEIEVKNAVVELNKKGIRGFILDLRDNSGGLLESAVGVVDLFISSGDIVKTKGRRGTHVYEAKAQDSDTSLPLVVLIDQSSASASEIVAGALQDHKRAVLVGERSYGKASVQIIQGFSAGGERVAFKITTAHYFTPSNRRIDGDKHGRNRGLKPDHEIIYSDEDRYKFLRSRSLKRSQSQVDKLKGKEDGENDKKVKSKEEPKQDQEADGKEANSGEEKKEELKPFVDLQLEKAIDVLQQTIAGQTTAKGSE